MRYVSLHSGGQRDVPPSSTIASLRLRSTAGDARCAGRYWRLRRSLPLACVSFTLLLPFTTLAGLAAAGSVCSAATPMAEGRCEASADATRRAVMTEDELLLDHMSATTKSSNELTRQRNTLAPHRRHPSVHTFHWLKWCFGRSVIGGKIIALIPSGKWMRSGG